MVVPLNSSKSLDYFSIGTGFGDSHLTKYPVAVDNYNLPEQLV